MIKLDTVVFLQWWGLISGVASLCGVGLAIYFQRKSKATDIIAQGFYQAISDQALSIQAELSSASGINNSEFFDVLRAKVGSIFSHVENLNRTISTFRETIWMRKEVRKMNLTRREE